MRQSVQESKADANECEWRIVRFEDDNDFGLSDDPSAWYLDNEFDPTDLCSTCFLQHQKDIIFPKICVMREWRSTIAALTLNLSSWNSSASDL